MNRMINLSYFSHPARVFLPCLALNAIFIPMWTVTATVNGYPFKNGHFSLFEWHALGMLYLFFYTSLITYLLSKGKVGHRPTAIIFTLWIIENFILYFSESTWALFVAGASLHLTSLWFIRHLKCSLVFIGFVAGVLKLTFILSKIFHLYFVKDICYELTLILYTYIALEYIHHHYLGHQRSTQIGRVLFLLLSSTPFYDFNLGKFILYITTGGLYFSRLYFVKFSTIFKRPLEEILLFSFFILSTGLIIHGFGLLMPTLWFSRATLHLLLTGGFSLFVLYHFFQLTIDFLELPKLNKSKTIRLLYGSIIIGGIIRFLVPLLIPHFFLKSLHYSMGIWTLSFLIYLIVFTPKFFLKSHHC